jgi:hypothetical protein
VRAPDAPGLRLVAEGPGPRDIALLEIEWFFQLAENEMSVPSNFGRILASVSPEGYRRTPEDRVEACTAYRRILGWLRAMPNSEAGVLQAAYEPRPWPWPKAVRVRFEHLAGIAVRLTCALDHWPEDRGLQQAMDQARALGLAARCSVAGESKSLTTLRANAKARLRQAVAAYLAVRGNGPSVIPQGGGSR